MNQTTGDSQTDECAIEGVVSALGTGTPISGAEIRVHRTDEVSAPEDVAFTEASGHFAVEKLEPGRYEVYAGRRGYIRQGYGQRSRDRKATTLVLAAGMKLHDIDFHLVPVAAIIGKVFDENNEPVPGVRVQALTLAYVHGEQRLIGAAVPASTNDLGEYRIYDLAPDHYYIGVEGQGPSEARAKRRVDGAGEKQQIPTLYQSAPNLSQATAIDVAAGAEVRGIDVVLLTRHAFHVRGRIVGFGPTYQHPRVQLEAAGTGWEANKAPADVAPSSEGTFDIDGVTAGSYAIHLTLSQNGRFLTTTRLVHVENADVEDANLVAGAGVALRVRVRVEGSDKIDLRKVRVSLSDPFRPWPRPGIMSSDGSFAFQNLEHDRYLISVDGLPANSYVRSIRLGNQDVSGPLIDLSATEQSATLEVIANPAGGQVRGVVATEKGEPCSGAVVALIPDSSRRREVDLFKDTKTDTEGRFTIPGISPGDYELLAWDDIKSGAWWDPDLLAHYEDKAEKLKIEPNANIISNLRVIPASAEW